MNLISPGDELVAAASLYRSRHPLLHGYTAPFLALYCGWLYTWLGVHGYNEWLEVGVVIGVGILLSNVLVLLSCYWSVHCLAWLTCSARP